jgi:multisubunit Na+/H+ antiporter MnhF subunit
MRDFKQAYFFVVSYQHVFALAVVVILSTCLYRIVLRARLRIQVMVVDQCTWTMVDQLCHSQQSFPMPLRADQCN